MEIVCQIQELLLRYAHRIIFFVVLLCYILVSCNDLGTEELLCPLGLLNDCFCCFTPLQPPFCGGNREKIQQKIVRDKIKLPAYLTSEAHSLLKGVITSPYR